ncbi:transcriptional regulator [Bacillus shivajii]|uniref:DsrE family protein n=1 Tax=Bacillus shivajii TaxID=1983719 RepID=UPI001CFB1FB1|nr:transcriptional regulator [Bacillus shivajii]UCZ54870.1 transcriptional regulator [Bacillus shivajii]
MQEKMVLLLTDSLGDGNRALGESLLNTYFSLLKQEEALPSVIFCMNRGVISLTEQSLAALHLKELEERGVLILACKTCTEEYGVTDHLHVGRLSSMHEWIKLSKEFEVMTIT